MSRRGVASLLAGCAVLAGCASMAPTYQRPDAPVAGAYPRTGQADTPASVRPVDLDWRGFFADPALERLIGQALESNRDLRVALANIEQARAQYRIRRAERWPSVGAGVSANRQPIAGRGGEGADSSTLYSAGVQVTAWELDLFGRIESLGEAALARYLATEEARKALQIALIGAVANGYLTVVADEELLALTRRTLATRQESLRLTRLRFDQGVTSELDLRQAESLVEAARAALAQQQRQRAQDENLLTLLVGRPLELALPGEGALDALVLGPELAAGLPAELLTRRPDLRQAEQQLIAANADIGAARAAFLPRITLTGSVGSASTELSGLLAGGSFAWSAAAQLLQPIFDAGRNRAGLEGAEAARAAALAQYERAIQTAFREVADALAGRATLGEQRRAQRAQADAEAERLRLSDLRYRNGVASYLDVLDAQRSLFAVQQAAIQVQLAALQNQVTLYQVLGGGWSEPPARTVHD